MSERDEVTWCGRPVSELSREELIEVIEHLSCRVQENSTPQAIRARALGETVMQFGPEDRPVRRCSCGRAAMFHTAVARTVVGNKPVMGWLCESCAGKEWTNVAAS
jgi:hypothetical protein